MRNTTIAFFLSVFVSVQAFSADFQVKVTDPKGNPVKDAVVTLKPATPPTEIPAMEKVQIEQKNREFIPKVVVIQAGGEVEFPNHDSVQHHVYSFSKPKRFDLPLYKEATPKPVQFDTPGVVTLGCNIHDWMKAYIYVTDTPFYGKSGADGILKISNVPSGSFQLVFWHPLFKKISGKALPETLVFDEKNNVNESVSVELKREVAPPRHTGESSGGY